MVAFLWLQVFDEAEQVWRTRNLLEGMIELVVRDLISRLVKVLKDGYGEGLYGSRRRELHGIFACTQQLMELVFDSRRESRPRRKLKKLS